MNIISRFYISNKLTELIKIITINFFLKNKLKKNQLKLFRIFDSKNLIITNYGRGAFYQILKFIKFKENRNEVLISGYNFFEIINAVIYSGLKPVFYDLEKNSLDADYSSLKSKISKKTCAVLVTHFNGYNNSLDKIKKICSKKKIYLIEDCAVALNSKRTKVGTIGDFSFFSLNMTKNLSSITGGIIKIKSRSIYKQFNKKLEQSKYSYQNIQNLLIIIILKILTVNNIFKFFFKLNNFLNDKKILFLSKLIKLNFDIKTDDQIPKLFLNSPNKINSLVLDANIKKFKNETEIRIKNNNLYYKSFTDIKNINSLISKNKLNHLTIEYPVVLNSKKTKINLYNYLLKEGFDLRKFYYRNCANIKIYKKFQRERLKNSQDIEDKILSFPNHPKIDEIYIKRLKSKIIFFFKKN